MRAAPGILGSHHHPLTTLLLQVVVHRHAGRRVAALGRDSRGSISLVAVELHRGERDIHARDIQAFLSQAIDHALAYGLIILQAAITGGQGESQQEYCANSHNPIITVSDPGLLRLY